MEGRKEEKNVHQLEMDGIIVVSPRSAMGGHFPHPRDLRSASRQVLLQFIPDHTAGHVAYAKYIACRIAS